MTTNDKMMRPRDRLADCYAKQDIPFLGVYRVDNGALSGMAAWFGPGEGAERSRSEERRATVAGRKSPDGRRKAVQKAARSNKAQDFLRQSERDANGIINPAQSTVRKADRGRFGRDIEWP